MKSWAWGAMIMAVFALGACKKSTSTTTSSTTGSGGDTGSGGSWPVSTDRVSWAFAAQSVLDQLDGDERQAFAAQALAALQGTVEADRLAAFDPGSGLYGGEQSFLDWRVQSYAPWITDHLARMAGARALSTNVGHHQALRLLAQDTATMHIPVIAVSANAMPRDVAQGLAAGFFRYLTKPIRVDDFMAALDTALDESSLRTNRGQHDGNTR